MRVSSVIVMITIIHNYVIRMREIPIFTCRTQSNLLQEISNISVKNNDLNRIFELRSWGQYEAPFAWLTDFYHRVRYTANFL